MADRYGLIIGGQECPAEAGESFEVYAPADGALVGIAARARDVDVRKAVEAAQSAQAAWAGMPPAQREKLMLNIADLIEAQAATLMQVLIDESGSALRKAEYEATYSASLFRAAAGEVRRLYGDTMPNDKPQRLSMVIREPLGVVAAISPFNAPLVLLVKMVCFPLAAGNTVIAKPSEETPLTAVLLGRIMNEAGLPPGTFNVITGYGAEAGKPLTEHPGVDGIAFTGSTATGVRLGQRALESMKSIQLELGGKNPLLVLDDMDPAKAADLAAVGAFYHGGQICMSSSRIIVEEGIAEPFAAALARKAESLYLGDLRDERTAYGPLINERAVGKVQAHIDAALAAGATLLCGGRIHDGLRYAPTVLLAPPADNPAWREETFGPVAYVVTARDFEHAIELANDSEMGLSAGVLTNDFRRGMTAARRIRAGSVHVGTHSFQSDAMAPIGGYGMSGIGRSGGKYSIEHFTRLKWISMELGETAMPF